MPSTINPNNIDTAYPVAGQDNNTQGFRTNFSNIKTNFEAARDEINVLQTSTVTIGGGVTNDLDGALIFNGIMQDMSNSKINLATTSGTIGVNYAAGPYQTVTLTGSATLNFLNFPAAGSQAYIIVRVTITNVLYTLTLPSEVGAGGSAASILGIQGISSQTITFAATGTYEFGFRTDDGGTSIFIDDLTRPRNQYINPLFLTGSEDLASGAAASLIKTISYFSTSTAETATLAAGVDGQIKVLAMSADGGDMVVTVTNAGWKTSGTGTITFGDIGDAVTLQYFNSKWYCIGNNGCTFA
jgi:hypothetical protein